MDNPLRSVVELQVRRVHRRLLLQSLLQNLALCGSAALVLSALWFLARPFLFAGAGDAWRWSGPAAFLAAAMATGVLLGWMRTPTLVASALALDQQFSLKERVTTLLTLTPHLADSPAGQALLNDVAPRVQKLHVASGFPLTLSWQRSLMPVAAMVLAVAAFFFDPLVGQWRLAALAAPPIPEQKVNADEIKQQLDNLKKVIDPSKNLDAQQSKEMKELMEEWEKLVNKDVDPKTPSRSASALPKCARSSKR